MVFLCLTRETCDQSRSETDIRNSFTKSCNHITKLCLICSSSHTFENIVRSMLDWNIQVMTDFLFCADCFDQFIRNLFGITIQNTNPVQPVYFAQFMQKPGKALLSVQVFSIQSRFLRYKNQFFCAEFYKLTRFCKKALHGNTSVISTYLGNNAIRASLITALCNL